MPGILCPTRGGEASYPNQDAAIEIAKQRGQTVHFLYVTDVRFLHKPPGAIMIDLEEQLEDMGAFLLAMAQDRADKRGVASTVHQRRGTFRQALADVIAAEGIEAVVLGSPGKEGRITSPEYLEKVSEFLVAEQGVEVFIVDQGEVAIHMEPSQR